MKASLRDYLAIAAALVAIFLSGYGIGFLFGERKGQSHALQTQQSTVAGWEERTMSKLEELVHPTPEQRAAIRGEIGKSTEAIKVARGTALEAYRHELSELNQRLKPLLTPEQWDALQLGASGGK